MARNAELQNDKDYFTLWWVESGVSGVERHDLQKIGWNMVSNCEVFFNNVELDESNRAGEEKRGFIHMMENFDHDRLVIAAHTGNRRMYVRRCS